MMTRNGLKSIKTIKKSKSKEVEQEVNNMMSVGLPGAVPSPTEKKNPGSIHDILNQMKVSADNPDAKAGRLAAERWRSARQIYDEFCTETSFTALTRIHKANHMYKRIAWLVLCLGMMTWLSVQCYWLFEKYFSYPVEVKIELMAVPRLEFPSVTICNLNPLKKGNMHRVPFVALHEYFHLDDRDSLYEDYWEEVESHFKEQETNATFDPGDYGIPPGGPGDPPDPGSTTTSSPVDLTAQVMDYMKENKFNKWKALDNDTEMEEKFYKEMDDNHEASMAYANVAVRLTPEELEEFGHHKDDMIISCHYMGMACSPKNFTHFTNFKYGNCYTINSYDSGNPTLTSNYAGPLMGLVLELNIEQKEYIPALSPDAGIRVLIHKRGTYPFPEDDGFSIPPGHMTSVALEVKNYIRLPPPHADCGNSGIGIKNFYTDAFKVDYTKQSCLKSCSQHAINDICKCSFSFYYVSPGAEVCEMTDNFTNCMLNYCDTTLEECNKKCPSPCDETKFAYTLSMSKWPSEQYESHLDAKLSKATSQFFDDGDRDGSEDTVAKMQVYFKELMYERMEEQKAYESQNLISDIGGQLGLWLGLSAITIGELVEFIASICRLSINKIKNGSKMDNKNSPITKVQPMIP